MLTTRREMITDFITPEMRAPMQALFSNAMKGEAISNFEVPLYAKVPLGTSYCPPL